MVGIVQLVAHKVASAFSAVNGGQMLFPNDFGEDLFSIAIGIAML